MSETIKILINDREEKELNGETKVRELLVLLLGDEEGFIFLGDSEEPLELDVKLSELAIKGHGHVHAHRCKRANVSIDYAGKPPAEREFSAMTRVKAVREWAVSLREFQIDPPERPKMALFLPGEREPLKDTVRIGSLIQKGRCKLELELALRERWQG